MIENQSKIEIGQLLGTAGFVAIFIKANYLIGDWSNAGFYGRTCDVMLQHFAVSITFDVKYRHSAHMAKLTTLIPDADVLLALAPEELAEVLLQLAQEHKQNNKIHLQSITVHIHGTPGSDDGYPQHRRNDIELAVAEAWNWLGIQGLLIPEPGINGGNGWMLLSRRAKAILEKNTFKTYVRSVGFPKTLLHPTLAEEVWLDIVRGDLGTAVFKSFRAVEIAVREVGGFADTDIGVQLMRKAFDKATGPLADLNQPESEREALAHLFAGAIGSYKNSHSHRTVTISDATEAQEMVVLASHLLRIVASRG